MSGAAGIPAVHGGEEVNNGNCAVTDSPADRHPRGAGLDPVVPGLTGETRTSAHPRAEVLGVEQVSITVVG
jgi:hypothetical protein